MTRQSAGILLYRFTKNEPEFLLVHPGGPFWAKKDSHAWSVPKGEFGKEEDPLTAALREFREETGMPLQADKIIPLTPVIQKSGKRVFCFAVEGDMDPSSLTSNTFEIEWPPHSGHTKSFPEIDRTGWFSLTEAKEKIIETQYSFIQELAGLLNPPGLHQDSSQ